MFSACAIMRKTIRLTATNDQSSARTVSRILSMNANTAAQSTAMHPANAMIIRRR